MRLRLDFAPLDGITKAPFRQVWARWFGGADRFFIPFFSPTDQHILTERHRKELDPAVNAGLRCVPQVMTRRGADFLWAEQVLMDMGYSEVNLNLGCPSGTVTAKGKGSGFLLDVEGLERFFDEVFSGTPEGLAVSVKTRLGYYGPEEFPRLLELFNRYPIACLTVHPRTRPEKYRGPLHLESFELAAAESQNPLCYNGDLRCAEDLRELEGRYPGLAAAMIGRGAVSDPALFRKARGGAAAGREELRGFLGELYGAYQEAYGQKNPAAQRMKEVWFYLIHLFEGGERLGGKMRRSRGADAYEGLEREILDTLELNERSRGELY